MLIDGKFWRSKLYISKPIFVEIQTSLWSSLWQGFLCPLLKTSHKDVNDQTGGDQFLPWSDMADIGQTGELELDQ